MGEFMKATRWVARGRDGRWMCPFCGAAFVWFDDPVDEGCVQGLCPDGTCNTLIMVESGKMKRSLDFMELIDGTGASSRVRTRDWSNADAESSQS